MDETMQAVMANANVAARNRTRHLLLLRRKHSDELPRDDVKDLGDEELPSPLRFCCHGVEYPYHKRIDWLRNKKAHKLSNVNWRSSMIYYVSLKLL